jgi:hypothetical protein
MNRKLAIFVAAVAALAFTCQGASAHDGGKKFKLKAVAIGTGAAATAGYFAINNWQWNWSNSSTLSQAGAIGFITMGCAAVSPMVATVVLNRPLTMREAHYLVASCIVPIIGGWVVNAAYDAHPEWEPGVKHHGKKKHKM